MKNLTRILLLLLLLTAVLIPSTVSASGLDDDKVVFGGNFTLKHNETLDGDLVVFSGNVTLEESSTVNGDIVVLGGNAICNGTINGNLVALGGQVQLQDFAHINGDLTVLGSSFSKASTAYISGNIVTQENVPFSFNLPDKVGLFEGGFPSLRSLQHPFVTASWFFFRLLIWTGLAILIALFIQDQAPVINRTAFHEPFLSIAVGLGVVLISPLVLLALAITILLSPVSLLGILALIAAWAVGLVAVSIEAGRKLAEAVHQSWPVPALAGVGMFLITLVFDGFNQVVRLVVPCVGLIPKFIIGCWVMGAVILTRFGTREYQQSSPAAKPASPELPIPPAFEAAPEPEKAERTFSATPAAMDLAQAEGLDLAKIKGSGADGKITLNDVRKVLKK
jgi:cytoskeletal protein CcmA (bactofilin family)